jgi:hypothetical protein
MALRTSLRSTTCRVLLSIGAGECQFEASSNPCVIVIPAQAGIQRRWNARRARHPRELRLLSEQDARGWWERRAVPRPNRQATCRRATGPLDVEFGNAQRVVRRATARRAHQPRAAERLATRTVESEWGSSFTCNKSPDSSGPTPE